MSKLLLIALAILTIIPAHSLELEKLNTVYFTPLDIHAQHDKELAREVKGEAPRFAVVNNYAENFKSIAHNKSGGDYIIRKRVKSPNVVSLNFAFSQFKMSQNSKLNIYSVDMTQSLAAYTAEDNNPTNELWTAVIMSDDVIIELVVPQSEYQDVKLELGKVNQGFRTFSQKTEKSGSCNVDVVCSAGDNWREEINSVAVISTGGSTFCTGFMVNNTNNDRTPYFMTAHHCRISKSNAASLVTYWNYQAKKCGGSRNGQLNQNQSGSTFLAGGAASDFTLVKLNKEPKNGWNVKYAGWDRSGVNATKAVAIHHPATDEKAISFENDGTTRTSYLDRGASGDKTHVKVADWDKGTTEPGSSGSPLFDQDHRVIGQLHGGWASCSSQTADYYGSFATSWSGNGRKNGSLKSHLDSANTGRKFVDTL